jgi:hypothetical protein
LSPGHLGRGPINHEIGACRFVGQVEKIGFSQTAGKHVTADEEIKAPEGQEIAY